MTLFRIWERISQKWYHDPDTLFLRTQPKDPLSGHSGPDRQATRTGSRRPPLQMVCPCPGRAHAYAGHGYAQHVLARSV